MGSPSVIVLKEFDSAATPSEFEIGAFSEYMDEVWKNRLLVSQTETNDEEGQYSLNQPFFHFTHDRKVKSNNYVGFTHWRNTRFEILPKVFNALGSEQLWPHLTYWLTYCRRINFPFSNLHTDFLETRGFPEALIYAFSTVTSRLLHSAPFMKYEEVVEVSPTMKGRLDINKYVVQEFGRGNPHHLVVEHSPFVYNNLLNQIIKSVANRLQGVCMFEDTFHALQEILFLLDEVDEIQADARHCQRVQLNRLSEDYQQILDMCLFFLSEGYLSHEVAEYQNFSFLLPMEKVFEDYLAGFIEHHYSDRYRVKYQSGKYLTDQGVFQMRYDLLLVDKVTKKKIIVDAKYKVRDIHKDKKRGISHSDMYQMVSYALRENCTTILLLYPQGQEGGGEIDRFTVSSEMIPGQVINVFAANVPFVHGDLLLADSLLASHMEYIFTEVHKLSSTHQPTEPNEKRSGGSADL